MRYLLWLTAKKWEEWRQSFLPTRLLSPESIAVPDPRDTAWLRELTKVPAGCSMGTAIAEIAAVILAETAMTLAIFSERGSEMVRMLLSPIFGP